MEEKTSKKKLTKKAISDFLRWTSSRYNICTKKHAVDEIYKAFTQGEYNHIAWKDDYELSKIKYRDAEPLNGRERIEIIETMRLYKAGSYCPGSSMCGGADHLVDIVTRTIQRGIGDNWLDFKTEAEISFL